VVFVVGAEKFCGPFDSTENLNTLKQESHFNNISIRISFLPQNNGQSVSLPGTRVKEKRETISLLLPWVFVSCFRVKITSQKIRCLSSLSMNFKDQTFGIVYGSGQHYLCWWVKKHVEYVMWDISRMLKQVVGIVTIVF
jgi:hypothetical protein